MKAKAMRVNSVPALLLALLCAVHIITPAALAEETTVVRVGYYENEVFQEGAREDAVKTGYAYEYYRKMSEYTGWEYEYVYGGFGDLYQMLLDGDIDLLAGLAWREDRAEIIGYPQMAMGNETYSLVKHNANADITSDPATFSGRRIGVLDSAMLGVLSAWLTERGIEAEVSGIYQSNAVVSAPTELVYKGEYSEETTIASFAVNENNRMQYYYIRTNFPEAEIVMYPSIDACLEAVASGKAGSTTLNGLRANDILKNGKYRELSLLQLSRSDDRCFGVKIGNEGLLKLLNRGVSVLGSDYAQSISYRYTDGLYTVTVFDVLREHMDVFGSAILIIAALIIFLLVRDTRRSKKEVLDKEAARQALEAKNRELADGREALSNALIAAEHANRAKTTFLNSMSHDIRAPMNAIVGFTALAASHTETLSRCGITWVRSPSPASTCCR